MTLSEEEDKNVKLGMKKIELLYICVALRTSIVVSCPEDLIPPVVDCLDILEYTPGEFAFMSDTKTIANFCRNGTFSNAVVCISKLLESCAEAVSLADPRSWQSGFDKLCNNIDLHSEHMPCISLQMHSISSCLKKPKEDSSSKSASSLQLVCGYFHRYRNCLSHSITNHCGHSIGKVFWEVVSGITPHKCADMTNNYYKHVLNTKLMILSLMIFNIGRYTSIQPG